MVKLRVNDHGRVGGRLPQRQVRHLHPSAADRGSARYFREAERVSPSGVAGGLMLPRQMPATSIRQSID
jgi:hypothetical protein